MSPIESLTDSQKARAAEFRDRWTEIGLCTDPSDRPRAEVAIREIYRQGGLEPPAKIVWCGSPLSQGLTRLIMVVKKPIERLWESVGTNVRHHIDGGEATPTSGPASATTFGKASEPALRTGSGPPSETASGPVSRTAPGRS
jgi:hypothetical protein